MEGKLINLLMTSGIEPDELVLQRKWLDDQYAVLSCGDEPASFRSHLAMGTLAFGYILPTTGWIWDLHP